MGAAVLTVRSILCPVDFSEHSRRALLWASAIARHRGGELTVLSVVEPLLAAAAEIRLGVDLARTEIEPALRDFVDATLPEQVRQASRIRMEVMAGAPSEAILQTSRRLRAGLIVMGTHGLGGFRKFLLGSTTEEVLRQTDWPVLAVPAGAVRAPAVEHPGLQLRKVLLATDFRESALAATQWAGDLAADIGVPLVLAHVVEPVVAPPQWQGFAVDFESDRVASGQRLLAQLSASLRDTHNDCVVSVGRPAETIASLAVAHGAGLVVMGLANPRDSERRKPGSIAYRVLRIADVAVVVVPACCVKADPLNETQRVDRSEGSGAVLDDGHAQDLRVPQRL
jgi:nucleotide-binding universal stress UspA family protein